MILYFIMVIALGGGGDDSNNFSTLLESAGKAPIPYIAVVFLDGLFHGLAFVVWH